MFQIVHTISSLNFERIRWCSGKIMVCVIVLTLSTLYPWMAAFENTSYCNSLHEWVNADLYCKDLKSAIQMQSIYIPQVAFQGEMWIPWLGLKHKTRQWKDSPFFVDQKCSQFWFGWSQSRFKRLFSLQPTPNFLSFSLFPKHTHIYTLQIRPYTPISAGPPAVLLGGLTQPIICRQPVGISLMAWQTVILNTTCTHRKGQVP